MITARKRRGGEEAAQRMDAYLARTAEGSLTAAEGVHKPLLSMPPELINFT